jgi:hypothetical protein
MVSAEGKSIIERAKRIYADRFQAELERDHFNRFVSIEPESGEIFLGDTLDEAVQSAVKKYPSSVQAVVYDPNWASRRASHRRDDSVNGFVDRRGSVPSPHDGV